MSVNGTAEHTTLAEKSVDYSHVKSDVWQDKYEADACMSVSWGRWSATVLMSDMRTRERKRQIAPLL